MLPPGCSQQPPPEVAPAPAPPPPSAPPPEPPAPVAPRLSELSFLLDKPSESVAANEGRILREGIPYGRGVFTHVSYQRWEDAPPRCPLKLPGACRTFSISTSGRSPEEAPWLGGEGPTEDRKTAEQGPFPAPHEWIHFSPGRDAVFALRKDGRVIDRIDDQGKITVFAEDPGPSRWLQLRVLEIGKKTILLRQGGGRGSTAAWEIAELLPAEGDAPRKPGPGAKLPMGLISEHRPNAQGARTAAQQNGMAMFGAPKIVRLDDQGAWAMVWLETVPPPYAWPAGKPRLPPAKGAKRGAKNGCGGPPSRGLDDRSVTKHAHVTRFSGATLGEDTVAWSTSELDPYGYELKFKVEGDKISVDPPPKATRPGSPARFRGSRSAVQYEELSLSPAEYAEFASFDVEASEGLALMSTEGKVSFRTFDAEGKWLTPATLYTKDKPYRYKALAKVQSRWFALVDSPSPVINLTDSLVTPASLSHDHKFDLFQQGGKLHLLSSHEGALWETLLDEKGQHDGEAVRLAALPEGFYEHLTRVHHIPGSPPLLASLARADSGEVSVVWRWLKPGAEWVTVDPFPDGKGEPYRIQLRPVYGDLVASYHENGKSYSTWLKAGKTVVSEQKKDEEERYQETLLGAFLFAPGVPVSGVLPDAPGPLVVDPTVAPVEKECNLAMPTRPGTFLFLCAQAIDDKKPGFRAGIRSYQRAP